MIVVFIVICAGASIAHVLEDINRKHNCKNKKINPII